MAARGCKFAVDAARLLEKRSCLMRRVSSMRPMWPSQASRRMVMVSEMEGMPARSSTAALGTPSVQWIQLASGNDKAPASPSGAH